MSAAAPHVEGGDARLVVRAGGQRFAVPARRVREIVRMPPVTAVPLTPAMLAGLGNVRGETLAIVSPAADHDRRQLLVLEGPDRVAIAIDAVERLDRAGTAARGDDIAELPVEAWIGEALPARAPTRRPAAGPRQARGAAVAAPVTLLRFALAGQAFALHLEHVAEVARVPGDIAAPPEAGGAAIGTAAWRDRTIGLLSPAALLGLAPHRAGSPRHRRMVVVSIGGAPLGLLVDRVEGLLRIAPTRIDPVPPALQRAEGAACIGAICRTGDGALVPVLAAEHLLGEARRRHLPVRAEPAPARIGERRRSETVTLLLVRLGGHRLALPCATVERIAPPPARITPIPGAPTWLVGMATIGGVPLPIVDEGLRLTGQRAGGARRRLLVIRAGGERAGLLVDEAGALIPADRAALAPASPAEGQRAGLAAGLAEMLAAEAAGAAMVLARDGEALTVLEPAALVSSAARALAVAA